MQEKSNAIGIAKLEKKNPMLFTLPATSTSTRWFSWAEDGLSEINLTKPDIFVSPKIRSRMDSSRLTIIFKIQSGVGNQQSLETDD